MKVTEIVVVAAIVAPFAIAGGLLYVVLHFIAKVW